ncbi:MAG TPA: hypothetical protein VJM08_12080 [Anaerolineales bacterium]|nr:hypothetical protein [Anaerolineales bacterium]
MNRKYLYGILSGFVALHTIISCVIPGQTAGPSFSTNPNTIETFIAGTAQVSAQATFISATLTSAPVITPTAIISSYGTSLSKREDGSTIFIDHRARVQIIFPANWLAIRVGEPEYYQAWEKEGTQNPALFKALSAVQNLDLNSYRITAFDTHSEHVFYDNLPKVNVVFLADDSRTLQQIEADERRRRPALADYKYLPSEILKTSSGLETLMIQNQWSAATSANQIYTGYYKGFIFKAPGGTVSIDLFIPLEMKELLEVEHNQILESVSLLNP